MKNLFRLIAFIGLLSSISQAALHREAPEGLFILRINKSALRPPISHGDVINSAHLASEDPHSDNPVFLSGCDDLRSQAFLEFHLQRQKVHALLREHTPAKVYLIVNSTQRSEYVPCTFIVQFSTSPSTNNLALSSINLFTMGTFSSDDDGVSSEDSD